jgi:hypothetical protein
MDVCTLGANGCTANETCIVTDGSFACVCNIGWTRNGAVCSNVNECTLNMHNCNANALCIEFLGSFGCICNLGYTGSGVTCTDGNECILNTHNCLTASNAKCTNTVGRL